MRVLITGGAGFVGSHLAERLLSLGDEVYVIDDLSTGSIENIQHLKSEPALPLRDRHDHQRPGLGGARGPVRHGLPPRGGRRRPAHRREPGAHDRDERARHRGHPLTSPRRSRSGSSSPPRPRSTASATRCPSARTTTSSSAPRRKGRWSYACSKAIDEFLAIAYWNEKRVPAVIVRLFNTVGARQTGRYGMVIPNFVQQALAGQRHHGLRRRLAAPLLHARLGRGRRDHQARRAPGGPRAGLQRRQRPGDLDAGAGRDASEKATSSSSRIVCVPYEEAYQEGFEDMMRRVPDISKAGRTIGYAPTVEPRPDPRRRDRLRAVEGGGPRAGRRRRGGSEAHRAVGPLP